MKNKSRFQRLRKFLMSTRRRERFARKWGVVPLDYAGFRDCIEAFNQRGRLNEE